MLQADLPSPVLLFVRRSAPSYIDSKLEAPTKDLMELIFSDIMFQQAMQVHIRCHFAMSMLVFIAVSLPVRCACAVRQSTALNMTVCFVSSMPTRGMLLAVNNEDSGTGKLV